MCVYLRTLKRSQEEKFIFIYLFIFRFRVIYFHHENRDKNNECL
ncbi:Unknown protein sequence [Pseudomonas syringae pv. helianthi]|uniref:Uncharacterized protein n=2 Tax=Pseudomonas syringae group genomosp. 7 TaxID=251699 RepID=A0A0P9RRP1_9PSED|nr:Unknown protein sequence [Pseudomonas syringae pv. helianthi]KPY89714.1 Unknown protein sequence [Pseudomonas syringae pv. tagetis]RMW20348.1 hypothetical protein ALO97_04374 [Pseudomonas syringae pv. tagetis]